MHILEEEIKALIISSLELEDVTPCDIDAEAALFGDGLNLDSIDALELGLAIKKRFHIKLEADAEETKKHFYSVRTLAAFIATVQPAAEGH